jgi:predicted lipoprotein with Yx(FWY)xxD motif
MQTWTKLAGGLALAVLGGAAVWLLEPRQTREAEAPLATPPGVTLQNMSFQQPAPYVILSVIKGPFRFAGGKGMTAYVNDRDTQPGRAVCDGDCAKDWPPILAPQNAAPFAGWSLVKRADGAQQWAYRGKPLYMSKKDTMWGTQKGDGVDGVWHVAVPGWTDNLPMPPGIALHEVAEAQAQVLVDERGMALYAFRGSPDRDKLACNPAPCANAFVPLEAPQAALPINDFTTIARADGIQHRAWRGRPLYTYDGDVRLGDANGKNVDPRFRLAEIVRSFAPAEVALKADEKRGGIWTTAGGQTLYAREIYRYTANGSHSARGGDPGIPQLGFLLGLSGCDAACEQTHIPLGAPADAQPSGYWTVLDRQDGSRQWAFQGYALYSYAGDQKPGEAKVADDYDVYRVESVSLRSVLDPYGPGLYWRMATP